MDRADPMPGPGPSNSDSRSASSLILGRVAPAAGRAAPLPADNDRLRDLLPDRRDLACRADRGARGGEAGGTIGVGGGQQHSHRRVPAHAIRTGCGVRAGDGISRRSACAPGGLDGDRRACAVRSRDQRGPRDGSCSAVEFEHVSPGNRAPGRFCMVVCAVSWRGRANICAVAIQL